VTGRGATTVAPVFASVTDAATADAPSPSLARVGFAFSHPTITTSAARALKKVRVLAIMCPYL
jgi:hypothetical protein